MKTFYAYFEVDHFDFVGGYLEKKIKADNIDKAGERAEEIAEILSEDNGCDVILIDVYHQETGCNKI